MITVSLRIEILKIKGSDARLKRRDVLLDNVQSIQESLLRNALDQEGGGGASGGAVTTHGGAMAIGGVGGAAAAAADGNAAPDDSFGADLDFLLANDDDDDNDTTNNNDNNNVNNNSSSNATKNNSGVHDNQLASNNRKQPGDAYSEVMSALEAPSLPAANDQRLMSKAATLKKAQTAAGQMARLRKPTIATPSNATKSARIFGRPLHGVVKPGDDGQMALPSFLAGIFSSLEKLHTRTPNLLTNRASPSKVNKLRSEIDAGQPLEWVTVSSQVI